MEQAPVKIGQYILGKNLGIGAFGKVGNSFSKSGFMYLISVLRICAVMIFR